MNKKERKVLSPKEASNFISVRPSHDPNELTKKLYSNLALPSYVHGYSLAIEYMYHWFESKFEKDYFKGGIYVDGSHVLDDYKTTPKKDIIKGKKPRARMEARVQYDHNRETVDDHVGPPNIYLRRTKFQEAFFRDYDNNLFLGIIMRELRMDFTFKVQLSTKAQQQDILNKMELNFRIGYTHSDYISVDFHVPKSIMLNIAEKAGFEIKNGEVIDIIDFLSYLNAHSEIPFLFKIRAINQKAEFFIRNKAYAHIATKDRLQVDDGERDGKLDFNFHIEMNAVLSMTVPYFYAFYAATELMTKIETKELDDAVAIYSINLFDIPKVDENGWIQAAFTEYATDEGETNVDISSIFKGSNALTRAIEHTLTRGISPSQFINIKIFKSNDIAKQCKISFDWNTKIAYFNEPQEEDILQIVMYYDREFINNLDIELNNYNKNRVSK